LSPHILSRTAPRPKRVRAALLVLFTAALAVAGAVLPSTAQAAVVSAGASTTHPYSDPVWWPLSTPSSMDCYRGNPGNCNGYHPTYLFDIIGESGVNNQPVYAMGAGIVHIGATNQGCGHAQGRGNYLYVDHGNGVLTYYGHLGQIFVRSGQYVSPKTRLAYVGNSGYARCHLYPKLRYLVVALKHGGTNGKYVEIGSTFACPTNGGARVTYPQQLPSGRASHWNAVRRTTPIPATSSARSCISTPARTAYSASGVGMAKHGKSTMYAHWTRGWSGYRILHTAVVLSEYHPSIHRWLPLRTHWLGGKTNYTKFHYLTHKRHYRVYVQFYNSWGYSRASANHYSYIGK
jgi:murein DD-endopeptidase MepM/ murein hydrolase activator NlpD